MNITEYKQAYAFPRRIASFSEASPPSHHLDVGGGGSRTADLFSALARGSPARDGDGRAGLALASSSHWERIVACGVQGSIARESRT